MTAAPTTWIDLDDLVQYLGHHTRPSGIQRVTFELCQALHHLDQGTGRVRFVRRGNGPRDLITVTWDSLEAAFRLITDPKSGAKMEDAEPAMPTAKPALHGIAIPHGMGATGLLRESFVLQGRALLSLAKLPGAAGAVAAERAVGRVGRWARSRANAKALARLRSEMSDIQYAMLEGVPLQELAKPGDSLLVLGSPWMHNDYVETVRWARDERRMRFALLIHDLVPLRRPEWCHRGVIRTFTAWHKSVLPLADQIFTNSRSTAEDVVAWAGETGLELHNTVRPVPMGSGMGAARASVPSPAASHLPEPGSYVLFVSTIEARKNHALLFRVWRRLLTELPRGQVPTLVFAGGVGWLVADFMQQLENAKWLDGWVRLVKHPTDAELAALYEGCQFTLFPSLFEGWGLPVSESLALGRPCVMSNRTSLPEVAGTLGRYFDPENQEDAYRVIHAVIEDKQGLADWRDQVAREFRAVPWTDGAEVIRHTLDRLYDTSLPPSGHG